MRGDTTSSPFAFYLAVVLQLLVITQAKAVDVPVYDSNCPSYGRGMSWNEYLGGVPAPRRGKIHVAGVEFRGAGNLEGGPAVGGLDVRACYLVRVLPGSKGADGTVVHQTTRFRKRVSTNGPDSKSARVNPADNVINVYGVDLVYNDDGLIFDHRGRVVGLLSCTLRSNVDCSSPLPMAKKK
jgi:hypothetical protein